MGIVVEGRGVKDVLYLVSRYIEIVGGEVRVGVLHNYKYFLNIGGVGAVHYWSNQFKDQMEIILAYVVNTLIESNE